MNSVVVRPHPVPASSKCIGRLLVIEPDAGRAGILRDILASRLHVDLVIVKRVEEALRSLAGEIPDLVLTSTFLAPAEEAVLAAEFKKMPDASHVQIINVPYFLDADIDSSGQSPRSKVMAFLGRRAVALRPRCDVETLQTQIEDYLNQATAIREERQYPIRGRSVQPLRPLSGLWMAPKPQPADSTTSLTLAGPRTVRLQADPRRDRRRAQRQRASEVAGLWTVRLPWGDAARIVDISKSGVLLESSWKVMPGTTIDLQLVGEGTNVSVPARAIRTDVADVDGFGVRYRLAAAFSHEVVLPGVDAPRGFASERSPRALVDLLGRVLGDVDRPGRSAELRARFESDLRRLLGLRDVQIRKTPVIPDAASESIYFTIPQSSGSKHILQVIFEPGEEPSDEDFRLLKAAATAAALVLELSSSIDTPARLRLLRS